MFCVVSELVFFIFILSLCLFVRLRVCVCSCVRACVRACVCRYALVYSLSSFLQCSSGLQVSVKDLLGHSCMCHVSLEDS